ncbi:conserved membrane hypothetical protein [Capnocytophaga canimorsus]|uniref:Uncharacterized protein n=1 Tax=Capnocytophaga canimorsus TaxID=28188 RepID=A0A0B7H1Q7_9FLAO|nr:hypothetical protein [Capnocytophaga canimorsus]ATA76472.1 hypothetical protein CGC47_02105 [Capnocytophaga canimorsus]PJI76005.1 hypothetical protein CLV61_2105 [Capnocytophaga canimorsus]CEN33511.1 conserved membrane hypothetical protein [Capnocytophaga canimorsus]STA71621.1 Uncharacterised protein [Capnocytophaga canimorsus]
MDISQLLREKQRLIDKGRELLSNKIFPDEVLVNIRDERLRKDIAKEIFTPNDIRFEDLSKEEQVKRRESLKVQLLFSEYLHSFVTLKSITYLLLIIGLITLITAILHINNNLYFGIITSFIGILLFLISLDREKVVKYSLKIAIIYSVLYLIELIILKIPMPYIQPINVDVLESRRGALTKIVNLVSPYLYVILRIVVGVFLFKIYTAQQKFIEGKRKFRQG